MNLEQLRDKSGLKIKFIINKLEVSRTSYRNYELGKYEPNIYRKDKLARLFNVSFETIEKAINESKKIKR